MFNKKGIEGILLHRALHRQHAMVYKWDKRTVYGVVGRNNVDAPENGGHGSGDSTVEQTDQRTVSDALSRQLLRMTSHGTYGRIFTYVIMLDGEWRFTVCVHGSVGELSTSLILPGYP